MELMLAMTVIPALVGFVPGVIVTVNKTALPNVTGFGLAAPMPVGLVGNPQIAVGEAVLRGFGALVVKSAELLFVSAHPFIPRKSELVALGAGAAAAPSKQFAVPYPTMSTTLASIGQSVPPAINVFVLVSTIFPAVAAIAMVPVASGVGSATPFAPPEAC